VAEKEVAISVRIPDEAYRLFKARCAREGRKVKDVLAGLIKKYGEGELD